METVTFYSYKGGSGRSLLLANTARYLALAGKSVVAIDLDFEAPGLHYKLHIGRSGERTADVVPERGVVDYLLASRSESETPNPIAFLTDVPLPPGVPGQLRLMPAGSAPSSEYWRSLTTLLRNESLYNPDGEEIVAIFLELKTRIEEDLKADVLLIDARTGITEFGGIATTILADKVVSLLLDNRESLTGARAVMRSFSRATRLRDQSPIEVIPVLSRVPEPDEETEERVLSFLNEETENESPLAFEHLFVLRDDRDLAEEERLYIGDDLSSAAVSFGRRGASIGGRPKPPNLVDGLGRDYVELIGALFPTEGATSEGASGPTAFRRQHATRQMRDWLTQNDSSRRHRPQAFRSEEIDEGVNLDKHGIPYADLVAYTADGTPVLAALYSEDLDPQNKWQQQLHWRGTGPRCIFLFTLDHDDGRLKTRAFTKARTGKFTERTDDLSNQPRSIEWWLRFPASYYALVDPGDQSVSALLASVQAGHDDFIGLLVEEWEHASFLTLHGGAPFRPDIARQIVDGLAAVKDVETAQRILWRTAPERFGRTDHGFHEGASLEELTTRNLHAPLFWRVPAAAKVEFWRHEMERSSTAGIEMLARDLLGFRFDQDQDLREDVERLMESAGPSSEGEGREAADTRELHYMWDLFQERGLTFEFSPEAPPELIRRTMIGAISPDYGPRAPNWDRAEVLAQEALTSDGALSDSLRDSDGRWSIITTNLLGNYDPATATVTLYSRLLEWTAQVLHIPITDLENVVFLHETVHAICHLGRDLDGRHWEAFALPSSRDPVFKPSELHEGIAQYFTLRMIERLGDTGMMNAFEALSNHQPPAYQAWRGMRSAPIEQIRKLLMLARATFDEVIWPTPRG